MLGDSALDRLYGMQRRSDVSDDDNQGDRSSKRSLAYHCLMGTMLGSLLIGIALACVLTLYISKGGAILTTVNTTFPSSSTISTSSSTSTSTSSSTTTTRTSTSTSTTTTSTSTSTSMTSKTTTTSTSTSTSTTSSTTSTSSTSTTTTSTPISLDQWDFLVNTSSSRILHTSTYISETNSILLVGGNGLATVQSINPSTASVTNRGNLSQVRAGHTADRLNSRVVLITGGGSNATADIYDPILGRVTATIDMHITRFRHASSVIEIAGSKRVLITGGLNPMTATGEVYNNLTGVFTSVNNNMSVTRSYHTATTLPNGCVIVAGGWSSGGFHDTLDLYNSTSNWFIALGARMSVPRCLHTATYIPSIDAILFAGGYSPTQGYLQSYDLLDVNTLTFRQLNGTMLTKRRWHTSTLLMDGRVLLTGGQDGTGYSNTCEIYDPSTNMFIVAANMSYGRYEHSATLLTSTWQVVACGGYGTSTSDDTCEIYTP